MKIQKIIKLLSILMIITLGGCGGTTPISTKTKYLYTQTNADTQYYKQKLKTKNPTEVKDTSINHIIWGEVNNDNNTLYLKSLQEYIKDKYPKIYADRYFNERRGRHDSRRKMYFNQIKPYCNNLYQDGINNWTAAGYSYFYGLSQFDVVCYSYLTKDRSKNIKYFDFLSDKEKLSIFTNYLITKKYNLKKDKFEKTSDFQERVSYVKDNIKNITNKYMSIAYNTVYGQPIIQETNYDADNELFYGILKSSKGKLSEKIAVNVSLDVVRNFYNAHKEAKIIYQYKDGKVYLKNIIISYNNKNYMAVLNKMDYKPSDLKVALYQDIKYGEKLISKLNNDIPKLLKRANQHKLDKHKWLFIIGIENYEYTNSVKYSTNSAKEFKAVMKKRLGIPENNVRTLINKGATSSKIDYRLKDMLRRVKKGDTIYFYYSGHGIPVPSQNNTPYLLAQDMNPAYLNDERFKLQTIYKELSKSKASKIIAFIDSCFSGGTDNQTLIKGVAATRIKPKKITFDTNKMVVISAGSGTQYSNKYDEKTNRLFSYFIMRGIIKNNTDTQRLYDYVKSNVQEKSYEMGSSYEQVPVYNGNIKLKL